MEPELPPAAAAVGAAAAAAAARGTKRARESDAVENAAAKKAAITQHAAAAPPSTSESGSGVDGMTPAQLAALATGLDDDAAAVAAAVRLAPPDETIAWRVRLDSDLRSFEHALKYLCVQLNEGNTSGDACVQFLVSDGRPVPPQEGGGPPVASVSGISVNCDLMGALFIALRHQAADTWVNTPTGVTAVRLCVRDLWNAIAQRMQDSVELWPRNGHVVVAARNTDDQRGSVSYAYIPIYSSDDEHGESGIGSSHKQAPIQMTTRFQLYMEVKSLRTSLEAPKQSKNLDVHFVVGQAGSDGAGSATPLIMNVRYSQLGATMGGFSIPLCGASISPVPDDGAQWGLVALSKPDVTYTDDEAAQGITNATAAFQAAKTMTLDGLTDAVSGAHMALTLSHARLLRMLPASGYASLRFVVKHGGGPSALVVSHATPYTQMLSLLVEKKRD